MENSRLRRLRSSKPIRDLLAQTRINPKDFILPYFVVSGKNIKNHIPSMPDVYHFSIDLLIEDIREAVSNGVQSVLLFGTGEAKDEYGASSYAQDGVVQRAVSEIKNVFGDKVVVFTDVCLCGYTLSGHCGVVSDNIIDNDATNTVLAKIALSHARAGADFVSPSAMMDFQVKAIRQTLDGNRFDNVGIMSYSAKFASNFYSPFRGALDCSPKFGDRKTYQMDYSNAGQALLEISRDIDEGADIVMVKPALAYLDIIYRAKQEFKTPLAVYNVSGEYAMVKQSSGNDKVLERELALESLTAMKRAGADIIISYFAKDINKWIS